MQKEKYKILLIPSGQRDMDQIKDYKPIDNPAKYIISYNPEQKLNSFFSVGAESVLTPIKPLPKNFTGLKTQI